MDADSILIRRMRGGDEAAIETFVRKHYPAVMHYCYIRTSDVHQAEDLAQETFYRFFRSFSDYSHKGRLANFLYVIAGNLCRDYWRLTRKSPDAELTEDIANVERDLSSEQEMDIHRAVLGLPEEVRDVIRMHFYLGMTLREIAAAEGIGLPLVKYRLRRGKELLRSALGKEE